LRALGLNSSLCTPPALEGLTAKRCLKAREEVAHLPLLKRKVLKAPRLLEIGLLCPVKRKPI